MVVTVLIVSQVPLGRHDLTIMNILSSDGHQVETGEKKEFDYYGLISVRASSYQADSDNLPQRTLDGETFTEVFNGQSSGASLELENYDFEDQKARYVKIIGPGNTDNLWNSITEVRINEFITSVKYVMLSETLLKVYPNPFSGGVLTVLGKFKTDVRYQVSISDLTGRKVYDKCLLASDIEMLKIQPLILPKGVYTLLILGEEVKTTL